MKHIIRRIIPIVLLLGGTLTGYNNRQITKRITSGSAMPPDIPPYGQHAFYDRGNHFTRQLREARSSGSWLSRTTGNGTSSSPRKRTDRSGKGEVTVTAGRATARIRVTQLSDTTLPIIYRKLDDLHSSAISPDGNIVGGYYRRRRKLKMTVVFIDLRTGERDRIRPYRESLIPAYL